MRSPREVQVLLSSIESREAALRAKVQQLAEEKSAQQQRLEEEVRSLQRHNFQMEAELRTRQRADSEAHAQNAVARELAYDRPRSPMEDQSGQASLLVQDTNEELRQQLAEIRGEVARCASALCAEAPLPTSEVADIRRQLAALSAEVSQTSHALQPFGPQGPSNVRDKELAEVRLQLEGLQGQVSRAMYAALSRPGVPSQQESFPRESSPHEVSDLRAEVGQLRAELARCGRQPAASSGYAISNGFNSRPQGDLRLQGELGHQIQALRMELGSFNGGVQSVQPHAPSLPISREPPAVPQSASEAASLQERLSWLRAEVARVVQDPRYAEDSAPPEIRNKLGNLLRELSDLRHGAEAVAAAAGGSPLPRRIPPPAPGHMAGGSILRETAYAKAAPPVSISRARSSSTPMRQLRPGDASAVNGSCFVDARPTMGSGMEQPIFRRSHSSVQPAMGMQTAPAHPMFVCPHVAADMGARDRPLCWESSAVSSCAGDASRYAIRYGDRYVDRERLAADGVMRGVGLLGETAPSATPTLGRTSSTPTLGAASVPSAPVSLRPSGSQQLPARPSSPRIGRGFGTPLNASFGAEGPSVPADEPTEMSPQGNMWRPMRSKISRP